MRKSPVLFLALITQLAAIAMIVACAPLAGADPLRIAALDAETKDWLDRLTAKGPAGAPATLGEAWRAGWDAAGLQTPGGLDAPRAQALEELRGAYRAATGKSLAEAAARHGVALELAKADEEAAVAALLAKDLPDAEQRTLRPHLDIDGRARAIAAKTQGQAASVAARTFGASATAALWAGGLARRMIDPTTLAAIAAVAIAVLWAVKSVRAIERRSQRFGEP